MLGTIAVADDYAAAVPPHLQDIHGVPLPPEYNPIPVPALMPTFPLTRPAIPHTQKEGGLTLGVLPQCVIGTMNFLGDDMNPLQFQPRYPPPLGERNNKLIWFACSEITCHPQNLRRMKSRGYRP